MGVLTVRALLSGVDIRALDFGSSHDGFHSILLDSRAI